MRIVSYSVCSLKCYNLFTCEIRVNSFQTRKSTAVQWYHCAPGTHERARFVQWCHRKLLTIWTLLLGQWGRRASAACARVEAHAPRGRVREGPEERCELPQWVPERSPAVFKFFDISQPVLSASARKTLLLFGPINIDFRGYFCFFWWMELFETGCFAPVGPYTSCGVWWKYTWPWKGKDCTLCIF